MDIAEGPTVFVVGDAATMTQDGHPVPGVAQAAIQQDDCRNVIPIVSRTQGWSTVSIPQQGNLAVVARTSPSSSPSFAQQRLSDWWVWAALHVLALPQLQNRFRVQRNGSGLICRGNGAHG